MKAALILLATISIGRVSWASTCQSTICEVCFSPDQACDGRLVSYINDSRQSLDIAIYDLTLKSIGDAILKAKDRGVQIRVIADLRSSENHNSLISTLKSENIPVKLWGGEHNQSGLMHNKFMILDGQILETGSYNYTFDATKRNAENQMYISDSQTISHYQDEFNRLWDELN